jgi:hypothetical protein
MKLPQFVPFQITFVSSQPSVFIRSIAGTLAAYTVVLSLGLKVMALFFDESQASTPDWGITGQSPLNVDLLMRAPRQDCGEPGWPINHSDAD